jgi:hypothetical protein
VILETLDWIAVHPKALIRFVVIDKHGFALPIFMTFDPKVVVALCGQATLSIATLQYALSQGDGSRNARSLHLFHSHFCIEVDIRLSRRQVLPNS